LTCAQVTVDQTMFHVHTKLKYFTTAQIHSFDLFHACQKQL